MELSKTFSLRSREMDRALERCLPRKGELARAMRYMVFSGGKRVRPFLVTEAAKIAGRKSKSVLPLASAIELIHTYSLVHDDLPDMDNSDTRRGKPSCHKKFGSAMAILVGDALLTLAFELLARESSVPAARLTRVSRMIAQAAGQGGMVGGQVEDLKFMNTRVAAATLDRINQLKTGRLITVSLTAGAVWAGAGESIVRRFDRFGKSIGSLYQVVDDIIDCQGYASLVGEEKAYQKAARLRDSALSELKTFGPKAQTLKYFVHYLYDRKK